MTGRPKNNRVLLLAIASLAAAPSAAHASAGGAFASEPAVIDAVVCSSACAGLDRARPGSVVRITGEAMESSALVVFLGRRGQGDDVAARVLAVTPTAITVTVPDKARSGRIVVLNADGAPSRPSRRKLRLAGGQSAGGEPRIEARVDSKRVFFDGRRKASLSYFIGGDVPADVRIDLARRGEAAPIATWTPGTIAAGTVGSIEWDGLIAGQTPAEGRYEFRVSAVGTGARAAQAAPTVVTTFLYLAHRFPVAGRHSYGEGAARFGAARSGHSHQGHDVFARCGTPLVAARGGTVRFRGSHSRAGNYIVVTGTGDGFDHVYMHLRDQALVAKGARVSTGQLLGYVGDTGAARGCHLHFEMWDAPGWYAGGHAVDPLPYLQAWDATS